jgi:uroporphyrinogen-III synthase
VRPAELAGAVVVVLRVGDGPDAVRDELERRGATAMTARVAVVRDRSDDDVRRGVGALERFAWVAVTSASAARRLSLWSAIWPAHTRVAAVGPATLAAVESVGLRCDAVAGGGTAADLAASIDHGPVLFVAAANARPDLVRELERRSIAVTTVVAYDVEPRALDVDAVGLVTTSDALVAMAPTAIDALDSLDEPARQRALLAPLVAFGPSTKQRAVALEWPVATCASQRNPQSVCDAVQVALGR